MYSIRPTTRFQKDLKRLKKRGFNISLLTNIIKNWLQEKRCPRKIGIIS